MEPTAPESQVPLLEPVQHSQDLRPLQSNTENINGGKKKFRLIGIFLLLIILGGSSIFFIIQNKCI